MRVRRLDRVGLGIAAVGLAGAAWAAGCAQGETTGFDTGGHGQGLSTSSGGGAVGGAGGGVAGGGGEGNPCGIDCADIVTDQCHHGVCNLDNLQCAVVPVADGEPCDDELFCTIDDTCQAGLCTGGPQNDCGLSPDACSQVQCDEQAQACHQQALPDGSPCAPADLCKINATCTNGLCLGSDKDCTFAPVPNDCHVSVCNPANGNCEPEPGNDGQTCADPNDLCTVDKICDAGSCIGGVPKDCSALTQGCFNGLCDQGTGNCYQQPLNPGDACFEAADACNDGVCDNQGLCQPVPANEGGPCEDGNPCTQNEVCAGGQCTGGQIVPPVVYFEEDFADNAAGWTLDAEWQIGPAQASTGHTPSCGNGDPATDHTPTADNGVAGVVIGGNASTSLHSFYYLTSPPVDTSGASPLYLGLWRWLNSDYTPYMKNVVEVFDGVQWVVVWETGSSPGVQDSAWTQQVLDIAAHANASLRVRIGFSIDSSGVYTCSQWNVDDVVLASAICP